MQQPNLGKRVNPAIETATGTSSLQGTAAEATTQHAWHCALITEQPSHSGLMPIQQHGNRQGAPILQQHSMLQQHIPACARNKESERFNCKYRCIICETMEDETRSSEATHTATTLVHRQSTNALHLLPSVDKDTH